MMGEGHMMEGMMYGPLMLIWWAVFIWFIVFTVLVVIKLDKIIKLLEKK